MEKFIDCDDICNMFNLSVSQDFIKDFYDIEPDSESEGKYLILYGINRFRDF